MFAKLSSSMRRKAPQSAVAESNHPRPDKIDGGPGRPDDGGERKRDDDDNLSIDDKSLFTTTRLDHLENSGAIAFGNASVFALSDTSQSKEGAPTTADDVWSVATGLGGQHDDEEGPDKSSNSCHPSRSTAEPAESPRQAADRSDSYQNVENLLRFPADDVYLSEFAHSGPGGVDYDFSTLRTDDGPIKEVISSDDQGDGPGRRKLLANRLSSRRMTSNKRNIGDMYRALPTWVRLSLWLVALLLVACIVLAVSFTLVREKNVVQPKPTTGPSLYPPPTSFPTGTPHTTIPSSCSDSVFKFVVNGTLEDCAWLARQDEAIRDRLCQPASSQAAYLCPRTCGKCP